MATKLQKDANRENAKKSTGPKTPEGKAKSAQNAVTHGLTACCNVIEIEDREEFDFFRQEMLDDLYPIGPMQYRLAERIVSLSWRLRRAEIMHDKTIDDLLQKDRDWLYYDVDNYRTHPDMPDNELALGHMAQSDFSKRRAVLDRLIMYERRIENSMYKTMKQLKILKNEPISSTTERQKPGYQLPERSEDIYEELPFPMSPKVEKMISRIRKNLKLDDIQDSTTENKESAIENPESSIEKMQNEPNYKHYAQESRPTPNGSRATGHESRINMQNEPNLHDQMNLTPAISKDYDLALLCGYPQDKPYPPQKPINQSRPKAESTNIEDRSLSRLVGSAPGIKLNNTSKDVISKRNGGRSEAYSHPRRPLRTRLNKK